MSKGKGDRPIIWTDDGVIMANVEPPLTLGRLREQMIEPLKGTPASLWWNVGDHEVYHYETLVGEVFSEGFQDLEGYDYFHASSAEKSRRTVENIKHLTETHGGPLTALVGLCREEGIEFFPRFRMNSHYRKDPASPDYGRFRREHPELLIGGPGEEIPEKSLRWHIRTGLNYAFPEVRRFIASIIIELFERFDVDGVEMDFNRHPAFFRIYEAFANRYLMTDLVRYVRRRMDEVAASRGKAIRLAVRVPPTLADSSRIGLDVEAWIAEGLVDIVTAGVGFIPFQMPIREFVEAAEGTDVQVYGCIEALRPAVDERVVRALASRFWDAGVDGIYMYNFYTLPGEWRRRVLNQIDDPDSLRRLGKRYELDRTDRIGPSGHQAPFRYAIPIAQLPVALHETLQGSGLVLRLEIADDLEAASAEGALGDCVLGLRLDHFGPGDALSLHLNGEAIPWESSRASFDGWSRTVLAGGAFDGFPASTEEVNQPGASVEFDVGCPPLRKGVNELEVRLVRPSSDQAEPVVINGLDVTISYRQGS